MIFTIGPYRDLGGGFLFPQEMSPHQERFLVSQVFPDAVVTTGNFIAAERAKANTGLEHVYARQARTGTKARTFTSHQDRIRKPGVR
jgi:hypothetical protein